MRLYPIYKGLFRKKFEQLTWEQLPRGWNVLVKFQICIRRRIYDKVKLSKKSSKSLAYKGLNIA